MSRSVAYFLPPVVLTAYVFIGAFGQMNKFRPIDSKILSLIAAFTISLIVDVIMNLFSWSALSIQEVGRIEEA